MNGTSGQPDDERDSADANWIFQEDAERSRPPGPEPAPEPHTPGDDYDLIEAEGGAPSRSVPEPELEPDLAPPPRAAVEVSATREQATPRVPRPERGANDARARVDPVWSRWGEWWPTILSLLLIGSITAALAYATFDLDDLTLSLAVVVVGGLLALVVSYPIVITMERPVRVTPEQAVNDYFGALCHHRPHYRRMWLLLSTEGRICGEYGSFEGFRSYWTRRLDQLRAGRASRWTPLVFQIEGFESEKSAGKSEIDVRFSVSVFARGQRDQGPITTVPLAISLVRGPDRMWYLNRGTLPQQPGA